MTMAIQVGDEIPAATLKVPTKDGIQDRSTEQLFGGKKVVLFSVPGAFTPTCSMKHLPGFVQNAAAIRAKGVDSVICLSVNDAFVMGAWGKDQNVGDAVVMAADGNGEFAKALGLDFDGSKFGMGQRSQRFALIAQDGVVKHLAVEAPGKFEVSSAEAVLKAL
jgi:peroxiredoxin